MQHQKQSTVAGNLDDIAICTSSITKTFGQIFSSHIAHLFGDMQTAVHVDSI